MVQCRQIETKTFIHWEQDTWLLNIKNYSTEMKAEKLLCWSQNTNLRQINKKKHAFRER